MLERGALMPKLAVFAAILAGFSSAAAVAQLGQRDGTNNVASGRIGMPGSPGDMLTQYETQKALNNLPTNENVGSTKLGPARPAKPSELTAGATVNDNRGIAMAKIEQVDQDGVVVSMGAAKVKIPADAFGRNKAGLLLDMTRAQFEKIVAKANAS